MRDEYDFTNYRINPYSAQLRVQMHGNSLHPIKMPPSPQFTAKLDFHFNEHTTPDRRKWFMFDEKLHRRLPMAMDGVDGLNTVGMWSKAPGVFHAGESTVVDCVVIAPEIYAPIVKPGVRFELWDGGFFATGTVLEIFDSGWPAGIKSAG